MPKFTVTPLAGPKVAGRPVAIGAEIELTEFEARAELLAGVIVPATAKPAAPAAPAEGGDAPAEATEAPARKRR